MVHSQLPSEPTPVNSQPGILKVFKNHLHKAKLTAFGSLMVVGVIQIILREQFPQIKPPWPWIGGALIVGLLGYIIIPPIIQIMRIKKS
jgi:hypothetical protein